MLSFVDDCWCVIEFVLVLGKDVSFLDAIVSTLVRELIDAFDDNFETLPVDTDC